VSTPAPEIRTLDNGICIVAEPMPGAQSVVMGMRFAFGAKDDPADRLGITRIAEDVLFKGTPAYDAHAVFNAFDNLGIRRSSNTSVEHTTFQAQMLPANFPRALALYAEFFSSASFPDSEIETAKAITVEELKRLEDDPMQQVLILTYQAGLGSPMGRLPLGNAASVLSITPSDVRQHWDAHCSPRNLIVSAAGGVTADEIFDAVHEAFGDWKGQVVPIEPAHALTIANRTEHHEKPSEQTHIAMLYRGTPRGHALYYPAQLALGILSGGGSSRLFTEVREKRGLAYSVTAFYRARRHGGLVTLYAGTTADRAQETLDVCLSELSRLRQDVTREELVRAKTVIKGGLFTTGDLPDGRASGILEDVFLQKRARSIDEIAAAIDAVTLDQIKLYLDAFPPTPSTLVALGPRPLIRA
jgi:predicted Zn-dependent peptidase